jgi:putative endopeptidase
VNYGAIGAVIGHEVSHSFDDAGSQFDAEGRLVNWWTPEDLAHFKQASEVLVKQYDGYVALPELHVNGRQTLGENIADVAGLAAAWDAWKLSLGDKAPAKDAEKSFFIAFGQTWRAKVREPALRQQVIADGHAPNGFRADTVRNLDGWYDAFGVKAGQKLYLAPEERVRIW